MFIHLHDVRTFCLPDGYEVHDSSLDDVKKCLSPTFTAQDILSLNKNSSLARDVYGVNYLPGTCESVSVCVSVCVCVCVTACLYMCVRLCACVC